MKKAFIILLLLPSFILNAQGDIFEFTDDKPSLANQYVILEKDSMTVTEGYSKIMEFIKTRYSSEKVIKSEIENNYIKIGANEPKIASAIYEGKIMNIDGDYVLEFRFKPNKIKMEIISIKRRYMEYVIPLENAKTANNPYYEAMIKEVPHYFNNLALTIKIFLKNDGKDDW